jgi:PAS domain S-box-containing protein
MSIRLKCILLMLLPVASGLISVAAATFAVNRLEYEYLIQKHSLERVLAFLAFEGQLCKLFSVIYQASRANDAEADRIYDELTVGLNKVESDIPSAVKENPRLAVHVNDMYELSHSFKTLIANSRKFRMSGNVSDFYKLRMRFFALGLGARTIFGSVEEAEEWLQQTSRANLKKLEQQFLPFLIVSNLLTLLATILAMYLFNRQLVRPLTQIQTHIEHGEINTDRALPPWQLASGGKGDEIERLDRTIHSAFAQINSLNQSELAIVQYSGDVLCSLNGNGIFTGVNKSCETFWGYPAESLVGASIESIIAEESLPLILKTLNKVKAEKTVRSVECKHIDVSGIDTHFLWTLHWVPEQKEFLCVCHDITEKTRMLSLRENICATLSHDMRTPLMSMSTSIELLSIKSTDAPVKQQILFREASQLVQKLIKLVNDVLDWKKIESGNIGLSMERISAYALAVKVAEKLETLYPAISTDLLSTEKCFVDGDEELLSRSLFSAFEVLVTRVVRSQEFIFQIDRENGHTVFSAYLPDATADGDFSQSPPEQLINGDSIMALNLPMSFYLVENIIRNHGGTISAIADRGFIQKMIVRLPAAAAEDSH